MKLEDYFNIQGTYELVDGVYNVKGNVLLKSNKKVEKLPVKFGKVTGYFYCSYNKLRSLEGSPKWVGDYFSCDNNNLTSFKGAPKFVGGDFFCQNSKLTSLKGSPNYIGGYFYCDENLYNTKEYKQYLIMKELRS